MPTLTLQHGDKIWTQARTKLAIKHWGLYDALNSGVIHNSPPAGVQLVAFDQFANGPVYIAKRAVTGFEEEVVARARVPIGRRYDLLRFNCEHLVNYAAEGASTSPQLQSAVAGLAVIGAFTVVAMAATEA